jgi:regulatory protein
MQKTNHPDFLMSTIIRKRALKLLSCREHSRLELHQKLIQRGFLSKQIDPVLDQLTEIKLLDEERYAETYAYSRIDKGYGPLRIARELRDRGIHGNIVASILLALDGNWIYKLSELQGKLFKNLPTTIAEKIQQTRVLYRYGFSLDQIKQFFEKTNHNTSNLNLDQ